MSLKSTSKRVKQLTNEMGMYSMAAGLMGQKAIKGANNLFTVISPNIKICDNNTLKINSITIDSTVLSHIKFEDKELDSMPYLICMIMKSIPYLRSLEGVALEAGQSKYLDSMPFSRKGIVAELISIYKCTHDELYAHLLSDLYSLNKSTEAMKIMSTTMYPYSATESEPILAYLLVLTLYPNSFYRVAYSALYALYVSAYMSSLASDNQLEESQKTFRETQMKYELDCRYQFFYTLGLSWVTNIAILASDKSATSFKSMYEKNKEFLSTLCTDTNDFYKYINKEISIDSYITNHISSVGGLSKFKREKITEYDEFVTDEFYEFYKSLDADKTSYLAGILDCFQCHNVITIENAIRVLVKSNGEKYFKSKYLQLFETNHKLSDEIKEIEARTSQNEKASNKEKKALVSENKKLKTTIASKEREIDKLKEKCVPKKENLVSSEEIKKLTDENDSLLNQIKGLNEEIEAKIKKCEDILSENERLKNKLNLYGISLDEDEDSTIYEELSNEDDSDINDEVPISEKIKYLNNFKIAICGSKRELVNRVGERGIKDLVHIDQLGNGKKNGKYDLYLICTDFISHTLVWQVETKVAEQNSKRVYFTGTNIDRMINVMYQALIK